MQINYLVLTLTVDDVHEVLKILRKETIKYIEWINWLEQNEYYGTTLMDWKPFGNKLIKDMIPEKAGNSVPIYSQSDFLKVNDDPKELVVGFLESSINILIIDPFVLFIEKYEKFLLRISAYVAKGDQCHCFRILPNFTCPEIKNKCAEILENQDYFFDNYPSIARHVNILSENNFKSCINDINNIPKSTMKIHGQNNGIFGYAEYKNVPSNINGK